MKLGIVAPSTVLSMRTKAHILALLIAATAAVFACGATAEAGVMLSNPQAGDRLGVQENTSGMAVPRQQPALPGRSPLNLDERLFKAPLAGAPATTGGMNSQTLPDSPTSAAAGLVNELPPLAGACPVARLAAASRVTLPSPLEDRLFRPPRG